MKRHARGSCSDFVQVDRCALFIGLAKFTTGHFQLRKLELEFKQKQEERAKHLNDLVTCLSAGTSARNSSAHIHGSSTIIIIIIIVCSLVIFISFGFNVTSEAPRLASLVYVRQQPLEEACVCVCYIFCHIQRTLTNRSMMSSQLVSFISSCSQK